MNVDSLLEISKKKLFPRQTDVKIPEDILHAAGGHFLLALKSSVFVMVVVVVILALQRSGSCGSGMEINLYSILVTCSHRF